MGDKKCRDCGGDLRWKERTQDATWSDHHNNVYECGECGKEHVFG